ncbi:MAG: hypothetical protein WKG07_34530 [Hymenobacter sp.]
MTTKDTYNSLKEIMKEIERLQKTPPTAEELRGIQNYEVGLFVLRNASPNGIVGQLSTMHLQGLPDTYLTEQVQRLNAVTPRTGERHHPPVPAPRSHDDGSSGRPEGYRPAA